MIILEVSSEDHLQVALRALRREWRLPQGDASHLPDVLVRMVAMASAPPQQQEAKPKG